MTEDNRSAILYSNKKAIAETMTFHKTITTEGYLQTFFHRLDKNNVPVEIPKVFLSGRVPIDAKCELENYFAFICKKYGI